MGLVSTRLPLPPICDIYIHLVTQPVFESPEEKAFAPWFQVEHDCEMNVWISEVTLYFECNRHVKVDSSNGR